MERLAELRVPAIDQWPEAAEQGGLMGYGRVSLSLPSAGAAARQSIARRETADIPVEQPTESSW